MVQAQQGGDLDSGSDHGGGERWAGGCYGNKIEVLDVAVKGEVFWKRGRMDGREQGREEGLYLQEMYLAISWSYN